MRNGEFQIVKYLTTEKPNLTLREIRQVLFKRGLDKAEIDICLPRLIDSGAIYFEGTPFCLFPRIDTEHWSVAHLFKKIDVVVQVPTFIEK
jgi:hypothetical protein